MTVISDIHDRIGFGLWCLEILYFRFKSHISNSIRGLGSPS